MKKRFFVAATIAAVSLTAAVSMTACGSSFSDDDAAEMIAGFTTSPTTITGTWVQDFDLAVDSDNSSFQAYAKDVTSTVTFEIDLTEGNVYYYGKLVEEDGTVTEQIVAKDSGTYYYKTSTLNPIALASESAAVAKIDELFKSLTTETSGWIDTDAFVYSGSSWVTDYILLTSTNVSPTSSYFTYTYSKTEDEGLSIDLDAQYVGYTGDAGYFEFGTTDTCTGSDISITTDSNGYILSFNQTVNNYLEMRITSDPIPLTYTGTRSLNATYGGTITHKSLTDVSMTANYGTVSITYDSGVQKVELYDYSLTSGATASDSTVTGDNYIAVVVTTKTGYDVDSVLVNGNSTVAMGSYYCYMTEVVAGDVYEVTVTTKENTEEVYVPATVTVTADSNVSSYKIYSFNYSNWSYTEGTTIAEGEYCTIVVECADGYEVDSVTINGEAATGMPEKNENDLTGKTVYVLFKAATSGATFTVEITTKTTSAS